MTDTSSIVWGSPLVVAILAAAVAGLFSAVIALINGRQQRMLERERSVAQRDLEAGKAEADRILEMIKTGDPERAAQNLGFLLDTGLIADAPTRAKIATYLGERTPGTGPSLPAPHARYSFEPTKVVEQSSLEKLSAGLDAFIIYLDSAGFARETDRVPVIIEENQSLNAYYDPARGIVMDSQLASDVDPLLREYMHHLLLQLAGRSRDKVDIAIESGVADYFVCSFQGRAEIGLLAIEAFHRQGAILDRNFLRTVRSDLTYADLPNIRAGEMNNAGARVWGSLLWALRETLGQKAVDRIASHAWKAMNWSKADQPAVFAGELIAAAMTVTGKDGVQTATNIMASRHFPVS